MSVAIGEPQAPPTSTREICNHCGRAFHQAQDAVVAVRCNIRRFRNETFHMWRCEGCRCIHTWEIVELGRYYEGYGTNRQRLDFFTRIAYGRLLQRFRAAGIRPESRFLDYGSGSGNLVRYLQSKGYPAARGYDPYSDSNGSRIGRGGAYDFICLQDVIEHVEVPQPLFKQLSDMLAPGGVLYIGTPSADEIDLKKAHRHLHQLHAPYHLHLYTRAALEEMGARAGLKVERVYRRFYAETPFFGMNEAFCRAYLASLDDTIDALLDPVSLGKVLLSPRMVFHGIFGYLYSPRHSVTVVFRKP